MLTSEIQIRFSDIDSFDHVNNINVQHYYDYGKMMYYRDAMSIAVMKCNPSIVIVNTSSNYFLPIFSDDMINVETQVIELGVKSIKFYQRIICKKTNQIKSDCTTVMVAFDKEKGCSVELQREWIESICKQEGKDESYFHGKQLEL